MNRIDQLLGKAIRDRRVLMGMSQADLGKEIGVSHQSVQKYERGACQLTPSRVVAIAHALGLGGGRLLNVALGEPSMDRGELGDRVIVDLVRRFSRLDADKRFAVSLLVRNMAEGS